MNLLPPGFRGLHPTLAVRVYRRRLPHWRQEGATYFVTFRLADSLPAEKQKELQEELNRWMQWRGKWSEAECRQFTRRRMARVERWLDRGYGSCRLQDPEAARTVLNAMPPGVGGGELFAAVIMPNHVHALVCPGSEVPLEVILKQWKGSSARNLNRAMGRRGPVWQPESFDRIVRDTRHLRRVVRYIELNPIRAGRDCPVWVTPRWDAWLGRT